MAGLIEELRERLPDERVQDDPDVVAGYAQDRAVFEHAGTATALVSPRSTEEVVAAVEAAVAADVPIVARGAGSGLTGGANAVDGCLMLSLHRMDRIVDVDTTNRLARVQPGVINSDLKERVAADGLHYPPDPASYEFSSIGGNVATNAGGLCCVKYGVTRDYVVGLEAVLADGRVLRTGRHTLKSTTGLDLTGAFVGSEGLLGIITEVTLKLVPTPPAASTAVAYFDQLPPAGAAIAEVFAAGHEPSMMEVVDGATLSQVEHVYRMGLDTDAAVLLIVQAEGDGAGTQIAAIDAICRANGATEVHRTDDPAEGEMLVEARRRAWTAFEDLGKHLLPEDVAVPRERLAELMAGVVEVGERAGLTIPMIGHAGDGNLHPLLVFDTQDEDEIARAKDAFEQIVDLALDLGGTMAGEHGVGTLKRAYLDRELDEVQLDVQRSLKALLDPDGRLNPGKAL